MAASGAHLLLLMLLLIPAPLVAGVGRWWMRPDVARRASLALLRYLAVFFALQAAGLALGALGHCRPAATLEPIVLYACILAVAVHALRPLFPRAEPLLCAALGLAHGFALWPEVGVQLSRSGAAALLAFGAGVTLMQLALVAIAVPWLVWLSRTRMFTLFRVGTASAAAGAAVIWVVRHAFFGAPIALHAEEGGSSGLLLLLTLAGGSAIALVLHLRRGAAPPGGPPGRFESSPS